jgi:sterol desaturase/sphingolipid hydroxylase (fatty acid hydroxylase superfamily)
MSNVLMLVVGIVVIGGVLALLISFLKYIFGLKTGMGDSASDGYKGMGAIALGGLVLVVCIAMFFYFLEYHP